MTYRAMVLRLTDVPGDEDVEVVDLPENGLITALIDQVEGDLDFITLQHPEGWAQVIVDDVGIVKNLGTNRLATMLVYDPAATQQGYRIAGTAVILGLDRNDGETLDLPPWVGRWVAEMQKDV